MNANIATNAASAFAAAYNAAAPPPSYMQRNYAPQPAVPSILDLSRSPADNQNYPVFPPPQTSAGPRRLMHAQSYQQQHNQQRQAAAAMASAAAHGQSLLDAICIE